MYIVPSFSSFPWIKRTACSYYGSPIVTCSNYFRRRKARQPTKSLSYLQSNNNSNNNNNNNNCKEDIPTVCSKTLLSLGLDIHTKSIGFAIVLGWTGQAIRHGMIDLHHMQGEDVFDKVDYVREQLLHLKVDTEQLYKEFIGVNNISWVVGVEAYLFRFLLGQSRAVSLFGLAELNTLVSYECRWIFQRRPFKFHASKARSWLGLSQKKNTAKDIKQIVFDHAYPFLLGFQTRYRPRSKAFCSTNFDISDAYVAARYAIRLEEERQLLTCKLPITESKKATKIDKLLEKTIQTQLLRLEQERIETSTCEVGQRLSNFILCHGINHPAS